MHALRRDQHRPGTNGKLNFGSDYIGQFSVFVNVVNLIRSSCLYMRQPVSLFYIKPMPFNLLLKDTLARAWRSRVLEAPKCFFQQSRILFKGRETCRFLNIAQRDIVCMFGLKAVRWPLSCLALFQRSYQWNEIVQDFILRLGFEFISSDSHEGAVLKNSGQTPLMSHYTSLPSRIDKKKSDWREKQTKR